MKKLLLVPLILSALGCAKHKSGSAPACDAQANSANCALSVKTSAPSVWTTRFASGDQKRQFALTYRFAKDNQATIWERGLTITESGKSRRMVESGQVLALTNSNVELKVTHSSCDDDDQSKNQSFVVYYKIAGNQLTFSSQAPEPQARSFSDAFAQMMGGAVVKAVGDVLVETMTQMFSFGSARSYLALTDVTLTSAAELSHQEDRAEVGCFSAIGTGYQVSKK